jgi:hypothetical protein
MDLLKQFDKKPPITVPATIIVPEPIKVVKPVSLKLPKLHQKIETPAQIVTPVQPQIVAVEVPYKKFTLDLPKFSNKIEAPPEPKPTRRIKDEIFTLELPKFHQKIELPPEPKPSEAVKDEPFVLELPKFHQKIELPPEPKPSEAVKHDEPFTLELPKFHQKIEIPATLYSDGVKITLDLVKSFHKIELPAEIEKPPKIEMPKEIEKPPKIELPAEIEKPAKIEMPKEVEKSRPKMELPVNLHAQRAKPTSNILEPITIQNKPIPKVANLYYNYPKRKDIAVLLVFFDYIGSARILANYLFMVEKLKLADIPVFTLELVIRGKKPKIKNAKHVYGSSYLFQKEVLIRLLEKTVPKTYTKIACLDADVMFQNPDWYNDLSNLLDANDVVQCFDVAHWLDISYTQIQKRAVSCLVADRNKRFWDNPKQPLHPGFGWAFTRDFYREVGFFDEAVIGSGDTFFAYGLLDYPVKVDNIESRIYKEVYLRWMSRFRQRKYNYLKGDLYHLYHGPIVSRQYVSRYEAFHDINNIIDVTTTNKHGVVELMQPRHNESMINFFKTRDDDGL